MALPAHEVKIRGTCIITGEETQPIPPVTVIEVTEKERNLVFLIHLVLRMCIIGSLDNRRLPSNLP